MTTATTPTPKQRPRPFKASVARITECTMPVPQSVSTIE